MPHKNFSGTVKINGRARLATDEGTLTLIPYPPDAPVESEVMEWVGREIFIYLKDRQATIRGELIGKRIYFAQVAPNKLPIKDVEIAPDSHDKFSRNIEQYFKQDSSEIVEKLNNAAIFTVSAFYHRVKDDGQEIPAFAKYLKVPEASIKQFLAGIEASRNARALTTAPPKIPVARGIDLARMSRVAGVPVKRQAPATPPPFPPSERTLNLDSRVDLRKTVTRVKDQGPFRGTCVAHATAAIFEHELIQHGKFKKSSLDLSEQYLYWGCKEIDGAPTHEGTFIEYAVEVLKRGVKKKYPPGTCLERSWRYELAPIAGNESQDPPPFSAAQAGELRKAEKFPRIKKYTKLNHNSIKEIKEALAANHCVGLSVYTYHFWTDGYAWREGVISLPFLIKPDGAHAICLVGYKDNDATHSDGYFIFKNSWGRKWGVNRSDRGYGRLPYRYVIKEGIEAWIVHL